MLTSDEKLSALSWKGEQLDLSYGKMVQQFNSDQMERIYLEYELYLENKRAAERARLSAAAAAPLRRRSGRHGSADKSPPPKE